MDMENRERGLRSLLSCRGERGLLLAWLRIDLKVFRADNLDSIESDVLGSSAAAARSLKKDPPPREKKSAYNNICLQKCNEKNRSPLGVGGGGRQSLKSN